MKISLRNTLLVGTMLIASLVSARAASDPAACRVFGFCKYKEKFYWFENGVRQGDAGDPKNIWDEQFGLERGREIYDPESDGWYWLDCILDGAMAEGKEVWMPYIYQNEDNMPDSEKRENANKADDGLKDYIYMCMKDKHGKWVRYDENGKMIKGWVTIEGELAKVYPLQKGNTYYYDKMTGTMVKGWAVIEGKSYHFDETFGYLIKEVKLPEIPF